MLVAPLYCQPHGSLTGLQYLKANLKKELYMFSQSVYGVINNLSDKEYLEKERDRLYNLVSSGLEEVNKLFSGEKE